MMDLNSSQYVDEKCPTIPIITKNANQNHYQILPHT